ncbi:PQ-loop repeat-containing protein [Lachnellula subtilissima]|uniref:PQ-loop repeat-containing protein n=1 Tax=Lachnellula subtilissima TaxID=602034 RepID=A0A8H8RUX6_9HELO|nr:PQ-loop repeat-containing protein [Lachnellula subtilissima]
MGIVSFITGIVAPLFIIISPITSYADQTYAIHRAKSSAGFSLDIPLIMLVASILRVFYYPGAKFDTSLLIQSFIMIAIQLVLLKVALDHRPGPSSKGGDAATPFAGSREGELGVSRPYNFWQWRSPKPYWQFLLYLFISLIAFELVLSPMPSLYAFYSAAIGYIGLSVEATLPLPQIISNYKSRSCKGFRISVLVSWLAGDFMKMFWFFTATSEIPWAFKLCGIFQMCCDSFLGVQYWVYGDGDSSAIKEHGHGINRARTPMGEKDVRLGD